MYYGLLNFCTCEAIHCSLQFIVIGILGIKLDDLHFVLCLPSCCIASKSIMVDSTLLLVKRFTIVCNLL